jgi:hypothetical protein
VGIFEKAGGKRPWKSVGIFETTTLKWVAFRLKSVREYAGGVQA